MVFREVVGEVVFAAGPVDEELALANSVFDPVKALAMPAAQELSVWMGGAG